MSVKQLELIKQILATLKDRQRHWTEFSRFMRRTYGCSEAQFYAALTFSIRRGWVVRPSRGVYESTEKGKKFLMVM